jgi:hypothetical protein
MAHHGGQNKNTFCPPYETSAWQVLAQNIVPSFFMTDVQAWHIAHLLAVLIPLGLYFYIDTRLPPNPQKRR